MSPSSRIRPNSSSKKSPETPSTPNSFGACPTTITSARPAIKPSRMGLERKSDTNPSRSSPATTQISPTISASADVAAKKSSEPEPTRAATVDADRSATAELGPTKSWRDVPNRAYSTSAGKAVYRPASGGIPATDAYAIASGTSSAHTVRPAITSGVSRPRS